MNLDDLLPKSVASPTSGHAPSPQQLAIYNRPNRATSDTLIEAVAGSGKTYTIVNDLNQNPARGLFLAFNKSISEEMKSRVRGADVKTLNGLGHGLMMRHRPGAKLVQWKAHQWLRQKLSGELYEIFGKEVVRAVGIAKGLGVGILREPSEHLFRELMDSYGLVLDPVAGESAARVAHQAFLALTSSTLASEFDFDDQLYVPVAEGWTFPSYDVIYVDEAQDLNPIQHLMLGRLRDRGARVVAVGDRRQAIYGFRGALTNSMDILRADFSMDEYPLSTTYRCDNAIVALAQSIVPQITARAGAADGDVRQVDVYPEPQGYDGKSLIICRNNAPIFDLALQFLKARLPCRVMSNFMDEIDKFIESFKAADTVTLTNRVEAWYQKMREDCEKRHQMGKLEALQDRVHVVKRFAQEFKTTRELLLAVKNLANSTTGPRISTIHKAKGLEADTVYLLRWDLLSSAKAITEEAIVQEQNLRYVAITRAKHNLIILPQGE
jgi:superfamily I DNA/RNA helicase